MVTLTDLKEALKALNTPSDVTNPTEMTTIMREVLEEHTPILSPDDIPIVTPKAARYHGNPVMSRGAAGEWDDLRVDNPWVIYDTESRNYKMWYSGQAFADPAPRRQRIGYATSPDGITWTKDAGNPIFDDPDWLSTATPMVIKRGEGANPYKMIYEATSGPTDPRLGALRAAESANGLNWTILGTITPTSLIGPWDPRSFWRDRDGVYHVTATYPRSVFRTTRLSTFRHLQTSDFSSLPWTLDEKEISLGYELYGDCERRVDDMHLTPFGRYLLGFFSPFIDYDIHSLEMVAGFSWDRLQWIGNSIYPSEEIAIGSNTFSYHEACYVAGPSVYGADYRVYYFQEYNPATGTVSLDINMAYLMLGRKRAYPVLEETPIALGATTVLGDCTEIPLENVDSLALKIEATYAAGATADPGIEVHLRACDTGRAGDYDSEDLTNFFVALNAGNTVRKTEYLNVNANFLRVLVENLDGGQAITDVTVVAVVG